MLKDFMLTNLIPQLLKGGDAKMTYIQDQLRAAVVMLSVCHQHKIRLDEAECYNLCSALCLPKLNKEDFMKYWAEFSQDVSFIKW